jgi:hypothetical protein
MNNLAKQIIERLHVRRFDVNQNQVSSFSNFDRPANIAKPNVHHQP